MTYNTTQTWRRRLSGRRMIKDTAQPASAALSWPSCNKGGNSSTLTPRLQSSEAQLDSQRYRFVISTRSLIFLCITMCQALWGSLPCVQSLPGTLLPGRVGQSPLFLQLLCHLLNNAFTRREAAAAIKIDWEKNSCWAQWKLLKSDVQLQSLVHCCSRVAECN